MCKEGLQTYADRVAPDQPEHSNSLIRSCIVSCFVNDSLCYIKADSVAPDQILQMYRLIWSYLVNICPFSHDAVKIIFVATPAIRKDCKQRYLHKSDITWSFCRQYTWTTLNKHNRVKHNKTLKYAKFFNINMYCSLVVNMQFGQYVYRG